jgi:hypothetical protein
VSGDINGTAFCGWLLMLGFSRIAQPEPRDRAASARASPLDARRKPEK